MKQHLQRVLARLRAATSGRTRARTAVREGVQDAQKMQGGLVAVPVRARVS